MEVIHRCLDCGDLHFCTMSPFRPWHFATETPFCHQVYMRPIVLVAEKGLLPTILHVALCDEESLEPLDPTGQASFLPATATHERAGTSPRGAG